MKLMGLYKSMARLKAGVASVRRGDFLERLAQKRAAYVREKRIRKWKGINGHVVARIQPGVRMRLEAGCHISREIYCCDFELRERRFVQSFLTTGDIFVDVGANIGLFTIIASRAVGASGRVYSIEPAERTFQRLKENIALNKRHNVSLHQVAFSDENEARNLIVSREGFDALNSFATPYHGDLFGSEKVVCTTFDSFAVSQSLVGRVAMMKIDVEGWEMRVLAGAAAVLTRDDAPLLQVEFTDQAARAAGSTCGALYNKICSFGYSLYTYDPTTSKLVPEPLRDEYPYANLIATKDPCRVESRLTRRGRRSSH